MRCVFSESLNGQTLEVVEGGPPSGVEPNHVLGPRGEDGWRAVSKVLQSPLRVARFVLDDLFAIIFPASCKSCDGPLERAHAVPVCQRCIERVLPGDLFTCERCGDAINLDLDLEDVQFAGLMAEGFRCRECRLAVPPFERAVSFGTYAGELRVLIHLLKFESVRSVAHLLGGRLAEAVLQLEGRAAQDLLVVAVPLFRARERERGYNQSVLLAREALGWLKRKRPAWKLTPAHGALVRTRRTEGQWVLSRKGRRRNLKGAFAVRGEVRGREILLIDDILTSGATARECARVLMQAGAAKVWVATLARAQRQFVRQQHEDPGSYVATWDLPSEVAVQETRDND